MGVDKRYEITLRRIERKDIMIFYATNLPAGLRRTLKNELGSKKWKQLVAKVATVEKAIVGIYSVVGTHYYDETDLGWLDRDGAKFPQNLPYRVKITSLYSRSITPIPLNYASGRENIYKTMLF